MLTDRRAPTTPTAQNSRVKWTVILDSMGPSNEIHFSTRLEGLSDTRYTLLIPWYMPIYGLLSAQTTNLSTVMLVFRLCHFMETCEIICIHHSFPLLVSKPRHQVFVPTHMQLVSTASKWCHSRMCQQQQPVLVPALYARR